MDSVLVVVLIFSAVSLGITACVQIFSAYVGREGRVRHRVENEFSKNRLVEAASTPLFGNIDDLDLDNEDVPNYGVPAEARREKPVRGVWNRLRAWVKRSGLSIRLERLIVVSGVLAGSFLLLGLFLVPWYVAVAMAGIGVFAPFGFVEYKRRKRRESILLQLPNAFDLMARVIRAGQSVPQALQAVADTCRGPIAAEFQKCQNQQSMGLRPEIAFSELAQRNDIVELRIFSMAMLIQRQVGGSLTEVLDRLGKMIRDRIHLRKKVKTLTAEGRLQALTLLGLPFVMFGVMMFINAEYASVLLEHPPLIFGTIGTMFVGSLWIRKIVNFEY